MEPFQGWTPEAVSMVERSIAAHGGQQLWQSTTSIRLPVESGSGWLLALKGYPRTFPLPREIQIFPHNASPFSTGIRTKSSAGTSLMAM